MRINVNMKRYVGCQGVVADVVNQVIPQEAVVSDHVAHTSPLPAPDGPERPPTGPVISLEEPVHAKDKRGDEDRTGDEVNEAHRCHQERCAAFTNGIGQER